MYITPLLISIKKIVSGYTLGDKIFLKGTAAVGRLGRGIEPGAHQTKF